MRFSIISTITLTGFSLATPTVSIRKRSIVTEVGQAIAALEDGLGVTEVTALLDDALGNGLTKLENALGITFAEYALGLVDEGVDPGAVQAIGEAIAMLEDGVGITAVNEFLDKTTGGAITSIEDALGVTDIYKALGLA